MLVFILIFLSSDQINVKFEFYGWSDLVNLVYYGRLKLLKLCFKSLSRAISKRLFCLIECLSKVINWFPMLYFPQNCINSRLEPYPKTKPWKFWNESRCCGNFAKRSSFIPTSSRGWRSASKRWICRNGGSPANTTVIYSSAWQGKAELPHPVSASVFRIALCFLVITFVGSNQGKY